MFDRALRYMMLAAGLFGVDRALAQNTCGSTKLACLLPVALHTNPPTFNFFNQAFATQIGQLPLATPASGFIYTFDQARGVNTAVQESFGPIAAERMETIGRGKIYMAGVFQRFAFNEIDGNSLGNLPIVFTYAPTADGGVQVVTQTNNRIDTKLNQYVGFLTYGLTRHMDVSVAVPFNRVSLGVSTTGTEYSTTTNATAKIPPQTVAGSAAGFGDVTLAGKGTLYRTDRYGIAAGMELRLPSGDEQNFLGSGAVGLKPYLVVARQGWIDWHLDGIYQWNTNSSLTKNANGLQRPLPRYFGYTFGADIALINKRFTVAADLVGKHFFDAPRISKASAVSYPVSNPPAFTSIGSFTGDYDVDNLALGLKINLWKQLLFVGNATIKLNDGGLRANVVPLAGLSYTF